MNTRPTTLVNTPLARSDQSWGNMSVLFSSDVCRDLATRSAASEAPLQVVSAAVVVLAHRRDTAQRQLGTISLPNESFKFHPRMC